MAFGFVGLPGERHHSPVDQKLSPAYPEKIREVIADVSKGTGFALLIQHEEAIMDADSRVGVGTMLELMRRWPTDPIGAGNLLAFFSRTRNWDAAEWVLRRTPKSYMHFRHARNQIQEIRGRQPVEGSAATMRNPFYGQPSIGGLIRWGDPTRIALGPIRRRADGLREEDQFLPAAAAATINLRERV